MKNSVLVEDQDNCVVCGKDMIQRHHVFEGTANRKISHKYGYWLPLCHKHHTGSQEAIHFNKALDLEWKQTAQKHFEKTYGTREQFIKEFIRSYL